MNSSEPLPLESHGRTPPLAVRVCIWLLLATIVTLLQIQFQYAHGKLAIIPYFDDVAYMHDGLVRINKLYTGGWIGLAADYWNNPPHAPFSMFAAVLAFAIFGIHDWAPYAFNGVIVVALLAAVDWICSGLALWKRVLFYLMAVSLPVAGQAVTEFRPDVASSLCAATGALVLATRSLTQSSSKVRVLAGVLLGLGLLFKNTTFALTGAMTVVALTLSTAVDVLIAGPRPSFLRIVRCWLEVGLALLLVCGWHYAMAFEHIWKYVYDAIWGWAKANWDTPGTTQWHLRFYFDGPGSQVMIGGQRWLLVLIFLGGWVAAIGNVFVRGSTRTRAERYAPAARLFVLTAVLLVAYAVPTWVKNKSQFFGVPFTFLWLFSALLILKELISCAPARVKGWRVVAAGLVCVAAIFFVAEFRFPQKDYERGSRQVQFRNSTVLGLYDAMRTAHIAETDLVYLSTTGYVNGSVLNYLSYKDSNRGFLFVESPFIDFFEDKILSGVRFEGHPSLLNRCSWAIVSDPGNGEQHQGTIFPSGNVQDKTLAMVREHPQFREVARTPTVAGKFFYLFKRIGVFDGWDDVNGSVGPVEGPYPQWDVPIVRWATGPATVLRVPADLGERVNLGIECRAAVAGCVITVRVAGKDITTFTLPDAKTFYRFDAHLNLAGTDRQIELSYTPPEAGSRAMLYRLIQVTPLKSP